MKHPKLLVSLLAGIVGLSMASTAVFLFAPRSSRAILDVSYLTLATGSDASQLTFSWHTATKNNTPTVRLWKDGQSARQVVGISSDSTSSVSSMYFNRVTVTELAAATTYNYQVGDGTGNWSLTHTTTTGDPNNYSFIAVGDPQIGASGNIAADAASWVNTNNVIKADNTLSQVDTYTISKHRQ